MLRQHHNAGEVVALRGVFLLGEVAKDVTATTVRLRHHVEEERLNVKIERLVLQEQFGHQAEVLTVDFVLFSVHFKDGECSCGRFCFQEDASMCRYSAMIRI